MPLGMVRVGRLSWLGGGGPWGRRWLGVIIPAVVWLALLALLFWAATRLVGGRRPAAPTSEALAIVEARYARGEITKAQFDEMKRDLSRP